MKDAAPRDLPPPTLPRRLSGLRILTPEQPPFEDTQTLQSLVRILWRRKGLLLLISLLTATLFGGIAALQGRAYTAIATVMLDPREQRVVDAQAQVVSDLTLNTPLLESEVAVIRSHPIIRAAVADVGTERFALLDPAQSAAPIIDRVLAIVTPDANRSADAPDADIERRVTGVLRQNLTARRIGDSYVIEIRLRTPDPALSADTANAIAQSYIAHQLRDRRRAAESATRWLADQVAAQQRDVARMEAAIEKLKRSQLEESTTTDAVLEQQLVELNTQLTTARAQHAAETARVKQIETLRAKLGPRAAAETQQSPFVLALRSTQTDLKQKALTLAATHGPAHPERQSLNAQLQQIEAAIAREVENIAQSYRNETAVIALHEASLQNEIDQIQARLTDHAAAKLDHRQLEREADAARETYQEMLTRLGETRAQAEIQRAEARLVNAAEVPLSASSPRLKLWSGFGLVLGLSAGLVAALSVELVSAGFLSSAQAERATGLPAFATIPQADIATPAAVLDRVNGHSFSLFAERIRHLRTMLEMAPPLEVPQAIAVLSSLPDEGKTTTAVALARSFAMTGRSTLLLDLDTRRSAITTELSHGGLRDLGDFLAGDAPLEDVIYYSDALGFSVAGSSKYTAILADSVSRSVLEEVVNRLRARFEIIVIDTPPLLAVSDAVEIAAVADKSLYLVQHRKTSRKSVFYGLATLQHLSLRPDGIVLTKADMDSDPDNYSGTYTYG